MPAPPNADVCWSMLRGLDPHDDTVYTFKGSVTTGFEPQAREEVAVRLRSNAYLARGRVYFDVRADDVEKVFQLRSVDHLDVIMHVDPSFGFNHDKEACLQRLEQLAHQFDWTKHVKLARRLLGFVGDPFAATSIVTPAVTAATTDATATPAATTDATATPAATAATTDATVTAATTDVTATPAVTAATTDATVTAATTDATATPAATSVPVLCRSSVSDRADSGVVMCSLRSPDCCAAAAAADNVSVVHVSAPACPAAGDRTVCDQHVCTQHGRPDKSVSTEDECNDSNDCAAQPVETSRPASESRAACAAASAAADGSVVECESQEVAITYIQPASEDRSSPASLTASSGAQLIHVNGIGPPVASAATTDSASGSGDCATGRGELASSVFVASLSRSPGIASAAEQSAAANRTVMIIGGEGESDCTAATSGGDSDKHIETAATSAGGSERHIETAVTSGGGSEKHIETAATSGGGSDKHTETAVTSSGASEKHNRAAAAAAGDGVPSFRVTCLRSSDKGRHVFESGHAAGAFGGAVQRRWGWTVRMTDFDLDVLLLIESDSVVVGLTLTKKALFYRNVLKAGPTTLRSTVCYNLLALARPKPWELVVDPLAGGGSISLEGVQAFPGSFHLCGDNYPDAGARTAMNRDFCLQQQQQQPQQQQQQQVYGSGGEEITDGTRHTYAMDILRWDAAHLPLRTATADVIVSDLPFGKRLGSQSNNAKMYPLWLGEMARICVPRYGRAVLLTHDHRSIRKALQLAPLRQMWTLRASPRVNIGGLTVSVYLLARSDHMPRPATSTTSATATSTTASAAAPAPATTTVTTSVSSSATSCPDSHTQTGAAEPAGEPTGSALQQQQQQLRQLTETDN